MSCDTTECSEPERATGPVQLLSQDQGCLGKEEGRGERGREKGRGRRKRVNVRTAQFFSFFL